MNNLLKFLVLPFLFMFIISCQTEKETSEEQSQTNFMKENVSITDARYRSVSENFYVKEIVLTNYSKKEKLSETITFNGTSFFDDGSYNDIKPNDGIYTSAAKFNHDELNPHIRGNDIKSIMTEAYIVDNNFKHLNEFQKRDTSQSKRPIGVSCDIEFGTCGCNADNWGWCDCCCFSLSNCTASISVL
jgi:hypothetical protein